MTNKQLRALQDEFLALLDELGTTERIRPDEPLFDKASPTLTQVQRDLHPEYISYFKEFIQKWDRKNRGPLKHRKPYYKYHNEHRKDQA